MKATLLLVLLAVTPFARAADKDDATSQFVVIFQQLQQLGRKNPEGFPQGEIRSAIDKLLPETLPSILLYRLGVSTCLIAYPQEAGPDIPFDRVFAYASHLCADLLAERTDDDSVYFLHKMQPICGPDGGEYLYYQVLIHRESKKRLRWHL